MTQLADRAGDGDGDGDDLDRLWTGTVLDEALADRWRALGELAPDSTGRRVHDFYVARGFRFPGEEGSAPPLLAQHDWVHVLADFGTTVESELEVFGFIARASDDPNAFALLAMVINLFQTGALEHAAGIFRADAGHLEERGVPRRLADALRRGALCEGSVDFLAMDFFDLAESTPDQLRREIGIVDTSPAAIDAGSVGPWERGGISPFQLRAGRELADEQDRDDDPFGAAVR